MKNKIRVILAVLAAMLLFCTILPLTVSAAPGDVVFSNDFNSGEQKFDKGEIVAEGPDGSNCYKWTATGGWSATYMVVRDMDPAKDYTITMKAKGSVAGGMGITIQNGDWGSYWNGPSFNVTTEWQDVVVTIPAGSIPFTAGSILFKWQDVGVAMDLYIDDLVIAEGLPKKPLCENGDFENGKEGWGLSQSTTIDATAAKNGNYGAHLKGGANWNTMMDRTFDVEVGKNYELSFWVKTVSGGTNMKLLANNWQGAALAELGWFNKTEWTQKTVQFTAVTNKAYFQFCGAGDMAAELYVDDVKLIEIKEPSFDGYLYNGDFETGKTDHWTNLWGSSVIELVEGMNGDYALKGIAPNAWNQVYQEVNVTPNTNYTVWAYAKDASGSALWIKNAGGNGDITNKAFASGSDWSLTSLTFNSGDNTSVWVGLMGLEAGGTYTVDDIFMFEAKAESNDGYIKNGNFETGSVSPWDNLWGSCPTVEIIKGGKDDNFALNLVSGEWKHLRQTNIAVEANTEYKISFYSKNVKNMNLLVKDNGDTTNIVNKGIANSDDWALTEITFNTGDYTSILISLMGGAAEAYGQFDNIVMEKVVAECEHDYQMTDGVWPTCETEGSATYTCSKCGDSYTDTLPAYHNGGMEHNPAKDALDCANPGNIENYFCPGCYEYFADAYAQEIINPWYIEVTVDCVKPEGLADCAGWTCETCGNENFGAGEHDVLRCQGGICSKCNAEIEGVGCQNYDTPACEDGVCSYCGGFVAGFGHENGAWAACLAGECSYGCGLTYPAAEAHVDDDADDYCDNCWNHLKHDVDPCIGGECSICWTYIEGAHVYFDACSPICEVCGAERAVSHNVIHVAAKAPTCTAIGNIEYWYCDACGAAWLDAECTLNTNLRAVNLPMAEHKYEYACAKNCSVCGNETRPEATHTYNYKCDKYCNECGERTNSPATHSIVHVDAKAPVSCIELGNIEYWYCTDCNTVWSDASLRSLTNMKSVQKPGPCISNAEYACQDGECINCGLPYNAEVAHEYTNACDKICAICGELTNESATHTIVAVEAKPATCSTDGNIAYWYCSDCGFAWLDAECTLNTNLKSVVLPASCSYGAVYTEAKAATCYEPGNTEYWYCANCDVYYADAACAIVTNAKNVIIPITHNIIAVEANAATCSTEGNIEYWYCADCGQAWLDDLCHLNTNLKSVVVPASCSYGAVYTAAKEATCFEPGNVEYWYCANCDVYYADAACAIVTNAKNVIIPITHNIIHVEANAATCTTDGNIEYWYCDICGQAWLDEYCHLNTNLKSVVLPASCSYGAVYTAAKEATCFEPGNVEYWYCANCDVYYADAACAIVTNAKNVIIPITHNIIHVEANAATCTTDGNIEYWYCDICGQAWLDEYCHLNTNLKSVVLPASCSYGAQYVEAKAATCYEPGNTEYWYCANCDVYYADAACAIVTNAKNVIIPITHNVIHVEAVPATCTTAGNIEYWYCDICGQAWLDELCHLNTNLKSVVLPASCSYGAQYFEAKDATCFEPGNVEYWYCANCDVYYADAACAIVTNAKNVIIPITHNIIAVEAKAATCSENGNIAYWYCADCGSAWLDELCHLNTNLKSVVLPASCSYGAQYVEAKAATCYEPGNTEYWYCANCDVYYADAACAIVTNAKNVIIPITHNIIYVEAKAATCTEMGNIEYWYCDICGSAWLDELCHLNTNLKSVVLPASCSYGAEYVEAKAATCFEPGNVEYWYCANCDVYYADAACAIVTNAKNVIIPITHNVIHVEAKAATCTEMGNIEYWYCADCGSAWLDELCHLNTNLKSVVLPASCSYGAQYFEAKAATCFEPGNTEYWYCANCDVYYADAACAIVTNAKNVIIPITHNVIHVEAKAATCTEMGNIEYWYCDICGQAWLDELCHLNTNLKAVILPALDHTYTNAHDATCDVCGAVRDLVLSGDEILLFSGNSISENVYGIGLAFRFDIAANGIVLGGYGYEADYTNATVAIDGVAHKLIGMGAVVNNQGLSDLTIADANEKTVLNVPALKAVQDAAGNTSFAIRILNIPEEHQDTAIIARPYFTYVNGEGVEITVYGEDQAQSYNGVLSR